VATPRFTDERLAELLHYAAELARNGQWKESILVKDAVDDLRGIPVDPGGQHTNSNYLRQNNES